MPLGKEEQLDVVQISQGYFLLVTEGVLVRMRQAEGFFD